MVICVCVQGFDGLKGFFRVISVIRCGKSILPIHVIRDLLLCAASFRVTPSGTMFLPMTVCKASRGG